MTKRSAAAALTALLLASAAFAARGRKAARPPAWSRVPGLYAKFETSQGDFVCVLWPKKAPVTVGNFVGLAAGVKEYADPRSGDQVKTPFYDGLAFSRVVPDYLIQSGDPKGDGTGGPGYLFDDEVNGLKFDAPGMLAMANYGPDTNGSQFFVTAAPAPALDDVKDSSGTLATHFTLFGKVVDGLSVVDAISKAPTVPGGSQPAPPVILKKVTLIVVNARRRAKPLTPAEAAKLSSASEKESDKE